MAKENKKKMSFKDCRKNLLKDIQAGTGNKIVEKRVCFQNNDVPVFLGRLKEFEQKSRGSHMGWITTFNAYAGTCIDPDTISGCNDNRENLCISLRRTRLSLI